MIGAGVIVLLLAGNLRGVRQAGAMFAVPTYAFIAAIAGAPRHPGVVRRRQPASQELHEAAEQVTANQAGLIAVGKPTIEKGWTRR
jgi:hypothetical protein